MHPALSVIFFTVMSGAGFGLVALSVALDLLGGVPGLATTGTLVGVAAGAVLAALGLMSSTLHLANPKNAWRSFFRFHTSWLSREAVFSVLFFPIAFAYFVGVWLAGSGVDSFVVWVLGLLTMLLAVIIIFTTSMIYASLRTIPQWNSPLVPANYLLLALASGAVGLTGVSGLFGGQTELVAAIAVTLVVVAGVTKAVYYYWIGQPQGPTINSALGMTRARVKLTESGQSHDSFLNKEFSYKVTAARIRQLRLVVYLAGFVAPALLVLVVYYTGAGAWAFLALAIMLSGLLVERWLFFAEARHVVNLFYGEQSS